MNIRTRLVVWHAAALAALLLAFTAGLYSVLRYHLYTEVDESLASWTDQAIAASIEEGFFLGKSQDAPAHAMSPLNAPDSFALILDPADRGPAGQAVGAGGIVRGLRRRLAARHDGLPEGRETITLAGQLYRIHLAKVASMDGRGERRLVVGRSLVHVLNTLAGLRAFLAMAWLAAVLVCSFVSWLFVGRILKPVSLMTRDSLRIAASGQLGRRIEDRGEEDEFGQLARALNRMLSSLEQSYLTQKRFLADASHELRTPLTSIKANLDYLARAAGAPETDKAEAFRDILAEVDRMAALVHELLALARAEAGVALKREPVDLGLLVREVVAGGSFGRGGPRPQIRLTLGECVLVEADPDKLHQVIVIILDNAVKYSPPDGEITIALCREGKYAVLRVADQGPGIPPAELPRVCERFYRASNVRGVYPGTGLGLSIAKTIVESHGGRMEIRNSTPKGVEVELTLA
ncbi:MAG: sensor histidine kinase [Bacteroidota bacterium]